MEPTPTNLNPLFIDQIRNFAHLVTGEPQTKEQFLTAIKKYEPGKHGLTAIFLAATERSTFETIRLNDTKDSILFNQ